VFFSSGLEENLVSAGQKTRVIAELRKKFQAKGEKGAKKFIEGLTGKGPLTKILKGELERLRGER
jgi:hypothetical protein